MIMTSPLVSIVVTTKNEEKNIENCLRSILLQTYKDVEIIVVDNNSTDKTKEIAGRYTDKVYDKGPERSAQRNYGMIDIAQGKYVMFVDADMILSPGVVKACTGMLENGDYVALHIPEIVLGKNYFSKVRRFERRFYDGTVIDGARFFRRDAFVKVSGFDETMSGPEDWDIDKKIKKLGRIGLLKEPDSAAAIWEMKLFILGRGVNAEDCGVVIYHNESEFDLRRYLSKKRYYAKSFGKYIGKWGKDDPDVRRQLGITYRYFMVFFEHDKWKRVISHPVLTLGLYMLRILVGIIFFFSGGSRNALDHKSFSA